MYYTCNIILINEVCCEFRIWYQSKIVPKFLIEEPRVTRHFVALDNDHWFGAFSIHQCAPKASPFKARIQNILKRMKFLDPKAQKSIFGFLRSSLVNLYAYAEEFIRNCA